ncbi:hypothetical protein, partial [Klebsiella pneumoniae]|uniref:hypothetical protein n=1 Tax=Klebsiella pneumoniae TaxID=573 RepID=UPI001CDCFE9E
GSIEDTQSIERRQSFGHFLVFLSDPDTGNVSLVGISFCNPKHYKLSLDDTPANTYSMPTS